MPINNYLVIGVNPANNETTVALDKRISITFAKHMDVATLNTENLVLKKVNGGPVPYTMTYSSEIMTARLQPTEKLEEGTQYQVQVIGSANGVKSITGDYMSVIRNYEFTTKHSVALSPPTAIKEAIDGSYVTLSWQRPADFEPGATLVYDVKVGSSSDPLAAHIWPAAGDIGQTTQLELNIPKKFSEGSYYAHIRVSNSEETSDWATAYQFNVKAPQTTPVTPPIGGGGPVDLFSFDVSDTYPRKDSVDVTPEQIFIVFSADLKEGAATDKNVYIIKKPAKKNLSFIDFLTDYAPEKQVPAVIEPMLQKNILTLTATLENDAEYTVIVRSSLESDISGALGTDYSWSFVTKYTQLYGDPSMVRRDLGTLSDSISDRLLYSYLKEASDYSYQVVAGTAAFNAGDYANGNAPYYVHEYTRLRASYDLIMNAQMRSGGGGTTTNIKLGDLSVEKDASTGGSVSGTLSGIKQQMKYYLDLMHGHTNRGYAKPSVVVRGENVSAYPDFLTRTEFKELGQ